MVTFASTAGSPDPDPDPDRLWLWVLLHKNPSLKVYRKAYLGEVAQLKALAEEEVGEAEGAEEKADVIEK